MFSDTGKSQGEFENHLMERIVRLALDEDLFETDITTESLREYDRPVRAGIVAKQVGVISGLDPLKKTFTLVDPEIQINVLSGDGKEVKPGDVIARLQGLESAILKAERTALNFIQRLSGIATITREFVKKLTGTHTRLLDTRKTTPGMRYLEKKAVRDGGGTNHRLNLGDMVLIKDNHISMAGSITRAVKTVRRRHPHRKIEVEVKNIAELQEALALEIDIAMLDNFAANDVERAVELNQNQMRLEVSGNITLDNIKTRIVPGIDFVSVGALTHSFKSLDVSLKIVSE